MDPVLVLQNDPDCPPGWLGEVLGENQIPVRTVVLYGNDPIPSRDGWSAIVSLGGHIGAYQEEQHPFLVKEKQLLRDAVEADIPVLGICLGCQLMADALGGRAYRAPRLECDYREIRLTAAGEDDPVLRALRGRVLVWHEDTFDLPPGAELLAESDSYPQAFQVGRALGVQPHPEVSPEILETWLKPGERVKLSRFGVDADDLLGDARWLREQAHATAQRFFQSWLDEVR